MEVLLGHCSYVRGHQAGPAQGQWLQKRGTGLWVSTGLGNAALGEDKWGTGPHAAQGQGIPSNPILNAHAGGASGSVWGTDSGWGSPSPQTPWLPV